MHCPAPLAAVPDGHEHVLLAGQLWHQPKNPVASEPGEQPWAGALKHVPRSQLPLLQSAGEVQEPPSAFCGTQALFEHVWPAVHSTALVQ